MDMAAEEDRKDGDQKAIKTAESLYVIWKQWILTSICESLQIIKYTMNPNVNINIKEL